MSADNPTHTHDSPPEPSSGEEESISTGDFLTELIQHQPRIYAFIGSLVHNQADVEDIYQQTCLILWKKHDQFLAGRDFYPWACGFAKLEAFAHLRKRGRHQRVYLSEPLLAEIAEEHLRTEREGEARRALLDECLEKLQGRQRDLLQRCYEGVQSIKDIAAEMSLSPAALTMRLQRIKSALLQCIEQGLHAGKSP